jgi:hypothetical protein
MPWPFGDGPGKLSKRGCVVAFCLLVMLWSLMILIYRLLIWWLEVFLG